MHRGEPARHHLPQRGDDQPEGGEARGRRPAAAAGWTPPGAGRGPGRGRGQLAACPTSGRGWPARARTAAAANGSTMGRKVAGLGRAERSIRAVPQGDEGLAGQVARQRVHGAVEQPLGHQQAAAAGSARETAPTSAAPNGPEQDHARPAWPPSSATRRTAGRPAASAWSRRSGTVTAGRPGRATEAVLERIAVRRHSATRPRRPPRCRTTQPGETLLMSPSQSTARRPPAGSHEPPHGQCSSPSPRLTVTRSTRNARRPLQKCEQSSNHSTTMSYIAVTRPGSGRCGPATAAGRLAAARYSA